MTLKALQAEWRGKIWTKYGAPERAQDFAREECASALNPHILQQERDRQLILKLYDTLVAYKPTHSDWKVCDAARSRLKEME